MKCSELDLHPDILAAAADNGFDELTPIQEQCLEFALDNRDVAGISQTGTGKTVAFLLPILQRIFTEDRPGPTALIVTPTRELCLQITEEAKKLTVRHPIGIVAVYGGEGYREQEAALAKNPHIVVATPGRLIDYIKQRKINTSNLQFLVLDEADRMFDMGFIRDIRYIMKFTPDEKQTFLFSATLSYYVLRLASDYLHDPVEVKVESESIAVEKIEQRLFHLGRQEKLPYLLNQLVAAGEYRAIIFTNYKNTVPSLVHSLRRFGVGAVGLSSALEQKKRVRLLKDFKLGHYTVLVATDVASRGLHVDDVTHVFNYDLPQDAEGYVHRIGRTARAGKTGVSISYCSEGDYENLPRIERLIGQKIPVGQIDMTYLKTPEGEFQPFHDRSGDRDREEAGGEEQGTEDIGADEVRSEGDSAETTAGDGTGRKRRRRRRRGGQGRDGEPRAPRPESGEPADDIGNVDESGLSVRERDRQELLNRKQGTPQPQAPRRDAAARGERPRGGRPGQGGHKTHSQMAPHHRHGGHPRDEDDDMGGRTRRRRRRGGRGNEHRERTAKKPGIFARIWAFFFKKKTEDRKHSHHRDGGRHRDRDRERPNRDRPRDGERGERTERSDRGERGDRPDRGERSGADRERSRRGGRNRNRNRNRNRPRDGEARGGSPDAARD